MALPCGTKDNLNIDADDAEFLEEDASAEADAGMEAATNPVSLAGLVRCLGFVCLTGLSLAIVAAAVLLPDYARLQNLRHEFACRQVRLQEAEKTLAAMDRLIQEAPSDEVLTKRMAWSKLGMAPMNEAWPASTRLPAAPSPGAIAPIRLPDPLAPDSRFDRLAAQFQSPVYRRASLVLAGCLFVSSVLLFAPPRRK